MVQTRSADSGVLGFTYQFLQTTKQILLSSDLDAQFVIEGIEDLDVFSTDEKSFIQYKYHEAKKFTLSTIDKPIALMFKHFLESASPVVHSYKLFAYFGKENSNSDVSITDVDELKTLFGYSNAVKILKELTWTDEQVEEFYKLIKIEVADEFSEAVEKVYSLLGELFNVTEEEVKTLYFANAIQYINLLATKKTAEERTITRKRFVSYLRNTSNLAQLEIINRIYGQEKYLSHLKKLLKAKNVKKNTTSYMLHLNKVNESTTRLIADLTKKFIVPKAKRDILPLTVIINAKTESVSKLKKELLKIQSMERTNIIFNDGYETFEFQPSVFNALPLKQLERNQQHVNSTSYNFRIISFETFLKYQNKITLDNPFHFFIGHSIEVEELFTLADENFLSLPNITDLNLLELLGG